MRGNNNLTFISCDCCMGKGPLDLCEGCVHNRNVIAESNRLLKEEENRSRFDFDFEPITSLLTLVLGMALLICCITFPAYMHNSFNGVERSTCRWAFDETKKPGDKNYYKPISQVIYVKVELDDGTTRWIQQPINCAR